MNATARAQAADALEQVARSIKRDIREKRVLLHTVKQAQVGLLGIPIETIQGPGGVEDGNTNENQEQLRTEIIEKVVPTTAPRFDFDLAPERDFIKFGGSLYELRRLDDFGIGKQRRLDRDGREFAQLWSSKDDFEEGQDNDIRLKFLLDRIFTDLLDAPDDVKDEFKDAQKAKVVLDFSLAPLRELLAANFRQTVQEAEETASTTTT